MEEICIFWFRRDLRLDDNAGLFNALSSGYKVLPVFIFDTDILNRFEKPYNRQVEFIHSTILQLNKVLTYLDSSILVSHTTPLHFFRTITCRFNVKAVYVNEDYELSAIRRDEQIEKFLKTKGIPLLSNKDHVIFSKNEVVKDDGKPYSIFTPYSRKWKQALQASHLKAYNCKLHYSNFYHLKNSGILTLSDLGYKNQHIVFPSSLVNTKLIKNYAEQRDLPALDATSRLGVHLRFGTISIRTLVNKVANLSEIFLNELIWREFYQSIAFHYPHICEGLSFKRNYDNIVWQNNETEFAAWCEGKTGYPIVDAGMRQLNSTGFMHNRVRMITASFLVKHLLIDWRWGESYFASKLFDFDFAANNGGWQWAAGSGCDAAPYFRIFNPELQTRKFDKNKEYIKKWLPEFGTDRYPKPIVEHDYARKRVITVYKKALDTNPYYED